SQVYKRKWSHKLNSAAFLVSTLRRIKPDVALSFSEIFNPLAVLAARILNIPIYVSDRSNPHKRLSKFSQLMRKMSYPLAHGMIAQTNTAKRVAKQRRYNKRIKVIPNPLREINDGLCKEYGNIIVSIGRLIPSKNFDELIEIFAS